MTSDARQYLTYDHHKSAPPHGESAPNAAFVRACGNTARVAGALAAGVGLMGLAGWVFDVEVLKALWTGGVSIKANASICLVLLGASLLLLLPHPPRSRTLERIGGLLAALGAAIGALTLFQHLTGSNLGIDQLLFREPPGAPATMSPGRMGPPASTSFLLSGLALLLLGVRTRRGRAPAQWLALVVGLIALLPLIGYAYSIRPLYGVSRYTGIALHTALAIAALAVGLLAARPDRGFMAQVAADDAGGVMARRMLIPAILLPFVFGWIRTVGQRVGIFDESSGRPALVLSLIVSFTALVWWNARAMSALGRQRARAEDERRRIEEARREGEERLTRQLQARAAELAGANAQLETANAQLATANAAKDEFLAVLSHELRTPLTPVLLTVSLMETHPELPADMREDVATIRRNVELESRLISDLLDLTRIERGKLQMDVRDVDLHRVVRAAADICQREASARLELRLDARRHFVRGDATRLQQVFWNLLTNAIKFTPPDGSITVRSSDADGGRIRVELTDTGVGIDAAMIPKLFNAFEQGDVRAARQHAGLGLGLAITKKLLEAHGGTIAASSEGRGRGASFVVELPAAEGLPVREATPSQPAAARRAARPLDVLLVEDHEPTLGALSKLLKGLGHRVTGVTTVASATAAAGQNGFDLIISDLGLPDGSGLDVMRRLRDRYAGRAIALTGYGMESDVAASRDAGFAVHLTKPVDLSALEAAMRRVSESAI